MADNGLIRQSSCPGSFHLLPVALRSQEKLVRLVDKFMEKAGCQKIQMPILTSENLWNATGMKLFNSLSRKVTFHIELQGD